jgi:hypothetical protein
LAAAPYRCRYLLQQDITAMAHNFENLKAHILPLSEASTFHQAKTEWKLVDVELHDEWDNCPCGKDIKELCVIENQLNGKRNHVGNVCVNQFIGIETGNLFPGLKRIAIDETANANADLIDHAFRLGYIFENEYKFLMETQRKRNLSAKQTEWKIKINRRILNKTIVRKNRK